jgi:hypothetical protein
MANWFFVRDLRCPDQPIPNEFAQLAGHPPCLELAGKPHYAVKRQNIVWNTSEILFIDHWNHVEFDVLNAVRIVNQIDPNHISSSKGLYRHNYGP